MLDHYDVKMLCHLILSKLADKCASAVLAGLLVCFHFPDCFLCYTKDHWLTCSSGLTDWILLWCSTWFIGRTLGKDDYSQNKAGCCETRNRSQWRYDSKCSSCNCFSQSYKVMSYTKHWEHYTLFISWYKFFKAVIFPFSFFHPCEIYNILGILLIL